MDGTKERMEAELKALECTSADWSSYFVKNQDGSMHMRDDSKVRGILPGEGALRWDWTK